MDIVTGTEMLSEWVALSNLAMIGLLMSAAAIVAVNALRHVKAPVRVRRR